MVIVSRVCFRCSESEIARQGYLYNSSLNPAFIPGRYMHLTEPRTCFMKEGVLQIPASVTPWLRFPLFWLSCHNLPAGLYRWLCRRTLRHDGYLFHLLSSLGILSSGRASGA